MTMLWQIVIHTPVWVWGLLLLVLWLGWRDLQDRAIAPARLAILPAVATCVSLVNILTSATPALALPAWLVAVALAMPLGAVIGAHRRLDAQAQPRRLVLAGSWFSMALGLTIFCVRYAMGVAVARQPALAADTLWIIAANAVGGAMTGIGAGWLACLVVRYRRALRAGAASPVAATSAA
ncbi:MAG: hypothetical protein KIT36_01635 [Alphaproteobacteria bacterium]|nr:hypothetical protein [Alphaproteobacteria bacterium]